jgi:tRNA A58 N-methylase Trm61
MGPFDKIKATFKMRRASCAPYVPSEPEVVRKMLNAAQVGPEDVVYDLGCGDGRILLMAVKDFGAKKAIGYELKEDLYKSTLGQIEHQKLEDKISVINGNLFEADISQATVITLYLTMPGNQRLKTKLAKEATPGTRIVSYHFMMNGWQTSKIVPLTRSYEGVIWYYSNIYLYIIPNATVPSNTRS